MKLFRPVSNPQNRLTNEWIPEWSRSLLNSTFKLPTEHLLHTWLKNMTYHQGHFYAMILLSEYLKGNFLPTKPKEYRIGSRMHPEFLNKRQKG